MSVFDIVWIAVIILWILRSMTRAGGAAGRPEGEGRVEVEGPREGAPRVPGEGREAAPTPARRGGRADWRERLLEAARDWELEQRRQAGEPIPMPGQPEPPPAEQRAPTAARAEAGPGRVTIRQDPRLTVRRRPGVPPEPEAADLVRLPRGPEWVRPGPPGRRGPEETRRRPSRAGRELTPRPEVPVPAPPLPPPAAAPPEPPPPEPPPPAPPAPGEPPPAAPGARRAPRRPASAPELPSTLEPLEGYSPLRRAVLYAEILGKPKALQEPPEV